MVKIRNLMIAAGALGAVAAVASPALAEDCGMSASGSFASSVTYDPFSPSGISSATFTLTLTRYRPTTAKKTQEVAFYFTTPTTTQAGIQITTTATGNLLYYGPTFPATPDLATTGGTTTGVYYAWGTASDPDTITLSATVTIPAGTDFESSNSIPFGIRYVCKGTGGLSSVTTPVNITGALSLGVTVLSGLQASYVGSDLDFGQVGTTDTATVLGAPGSYTQSGNIRVASSGPFTVAVTSDNNYQLTAGGADTLDYKMHFLGQDRTNASPTFTTVTCDYVGLTGVYLPISAILQEGGVGKAPGAYADTINVTVSPIVSAASPDTCPSL